MKSTCANTKLVLALAAGFLGLGCGVAIAQQKQVIVSDDTSVKASIPIKNASISADGHVEVKCAQNPCPAMGGGTGSGSAPAITFSGVPANSPANPLPVGSTANLSWTSPGHQICFGVNSNPAVSAWGKALASVNSFSVSQLQRSQNSTVTYDLTLRCYETKVPILNATGESAYRDATYSISLAQSTVTDPEPGGDSCEAFYPAGSAARNQPGFTTPLTRVNMSFASIYGMELSTMLNQGGSSRVVLPAGHAGNQRYLSIPMDVPANTPDNKGIYIAWVEPQGADPAVESDVEYSISPCPGDFRAVPSSVVHSWDSMQCRGHLTDNGSVVLTTGVGGNAQGACRLPKGGRVYLNVTHHTLTGYRASGAPPVTTCTGSTPCGKVFFASEY